MHSGEDGTWHDDAGPEFTYDMYWDFCQGMKYAFQRRPLCKSQFGRNLANTVYSVRSSVWLSVERKKSNYYDPSSTYSYGGAADSYTLYQIRSTGKGWR